MEWTGAEVSKEASAHEDHTEEEVEENDVAPIEGCTGIVMDNLDENMTVEDIKTILKKGCSEETLKSCSIHPTGSLRSKIIEFPDADLIPLNAKKVNKSSFNGRIVFCKAFVPILLPKKIQPA